MILRSQTTQKIEKIDTDDQYVSVSVFLTKQFGQFTVNSVYLMDNLDYFWCNLDSLGNFGSLGG